MTQTTYARRAPHSKVPVMSLQGETDTDAGRHGYLPKSDCAATGRCFAGLSGILGHPVITVILSPPIVSRVPAATVFRDPNGRANLSAKFSGEQSCLFLCCLKGHFTSAIAMLAQLGSAKLNAELRKHRDRAREM